MNSTFSKEDSLAVKGVAILMMLWHHCLGIENLTANPWPLETSQILHIAVFCKICVSFFAFISGYGLWWSYQVEKGSERRPAKWIVRRLIHTFSGYWFVVFWPWIICGAINGWTYQWYPFEESPLLGLWTMFMDLLGLTNFFGGKPINPIWWYMSAAIIYIIILPLFDKLMDCVGELCAIAIIWITSGLQGGYPGAEHFLSFLTMFCMGAVFASKDIFTHWIRFWGKRHSWLRYPALAAMTGVVYKLYHALDINYWWNVKFSLIPIVVIFLIWEMTRLVPLFGNILGFLGKHATNIFLVHAFLYAYYCSAFIYGAGHWMLILCRLLWSSLMISVVIEGLKKLTRYNLWIEKVGDIVVEKI